MKKHRITKSDPRYQSAYVANGFVGLRVGTNPFVGQTALLAGFTGSHERFGVEAFAPIPAVQYNLMMDGSSLQTNPEGYQLLEQTYDFSCGELLTSFTFTNARGQKLMGTSLVYCSRSCPSVVVQETQIEVMQECELQFSTLMETSKLSIKTRLTLVPFVDCDGVLWIESRDGSTSAGIATYLQCKGDTEIRKINTDYQWGYEQERLTKTYGVQAVPGKTYQYSMMTSYIPSTLHSEPHWQAVRMIKLVQWKGFAKLREENRAAWAKLWESRIRIIGASEEWQDVVAASFFYLYCTVHPSSPQSIAPYGLSQRDHYYGHVFWDTESFMFMLPLFTDPASAKAILDYRFNRLEAARHNAMINGYNGIQFPWQSGTTGDEVTPVFAAGAAGAGEQHINMDVAMAFIAYAQVSGDEEFLRERAWPVVKGVSEWIESRVTRTKRGYEILFVTGIDESTDRVNNDSYTNILCKIVLEHTNRIAARIGYPVNPLWKEIAETMFVPVHSELKFIEQYEGCKIKDSMDPHSLMAFFPYGYSHSKTVDENTFRFFIEHDLQRYLAYPMPCGFLGVVPSRLGNRQLSRKYFDEGALQFFVEPFMLSIEAGAILYKNILDKLTTVFLTGRGSLMTGLLMGLTRLDIWQEDFENWFAGPIVMPEGWEGIVLEKVYLKGKCARITAMHGDSKAKIEWL
jgi:trehalose/maltose hydrolase-like predicted phosphorylase